MTNIVSELTIAALGGDEIMPAYASMLRSACETEAPPYSKRPFGEQYRTLARDPSWFVNLLVSDADLEGYSAKQLWAYGCAIGDPDFAEGLKRHAVDEARHSRMFTGMLFSLFPELETTENRRKMLAYAPSLTEPEKTGHLADRPFEELLNAAVLINLHEVKALILEKLLRPVMRAYGTPDLGPKINSAMDALMRDEVEHIRYSAAFIERCANTGYKDYLGDAMVEFQASLNDVTQEEADKAKPVSTTPGEAVAIFESQPGEELVENV